MQKLRATAVYRGDDVLGESPVWDACDGVLYWVDIRKGALHRLRVKQRGLAPETFTFGAGLLTGVVTARDALLVGFERSIASIDKQHLARPGAARQQVNAGFLPVDNRLNEIKTDPQGRIWCGAMRDYAKECTGGLFRADVSGRLVRIRADVTVPNSVAFSPDGNWIYFADSATGVIERAPFDSHSGSVGEWQALVGTGQAPGKPDGLAVDADGGLWSARFGAGCVIRFTSEGKRDICVELPVSQPTSCAFGGPDLSTLYVTTATQGLSHEVRAQEPLAGSLFAVTTRTAGLPVCEAVMPDL